MNIVGGGGSVYVVREERYKKTDKRADVLKKGEIGTDGGGRLLVGIVQSCVCGRVK